MCQVSQILFHGDLKLQILTPGNRNKAIELCRFLQLFLLPSHGNMPRSFIDTLVQSQSKVVKESRSGTRVSWLNRLPEISHNHVKNYPKSKETAIGRAHCSLPWLWRKSMFLQDSDFANLMLVLMVRMMQNLSEIGFRFVWLFPFCPC